MLDLSSPAFEEHQMIPERYTCHGEDINPPLHIEEIPSGTKSLVLIVNDPDAPAGIWVHWVLWNIPVVRDIAEDSIPEGAVQGKNSWKQNNYRGPCPPSGTHRYFFHLYAINTRLDLPTETTAQEIKAAIKNQILAETTLIGRYKKP